MSENELDRIAFYEKERQGIYIHRKLLQDIPFQPGDRFSSRTSPTASNCGRCRSSWTNPKNGIDPMIT